MANVLENVRRAACELVTQGVDRVVALPGKPEGPPNKVFQVKLGFASKDLEDTVGLLEDLRLLKNPALIFKQGVGGNRVENATTPQVEALNRNLSAMMRDVNFDIRKPGALEAVQRFIGLNQGESALVSPDGSPERAKETLVLGPKTAYRLLEHLKNKTGTVQLANRCI